MDKGVRVPYFAVMISRDWQCLNPKCHKVFHSYEHGNPDCTFCGCARVAWIPGGGHIGKASPGADQMLKGLAKSYGMKNINSGSASRLNRAMPKYEAPPADGPVLTYAPGFSAPFNMGGRSTCEPSHNHVNFKVTSAAEKPLGPGPNMGGRPAPDIGRTGWASHRTAYRG